MNQSVLRRWAWAAMAPLLLGAACLPRPFLDEYGYVSCTSDDDCVTGRMCQVDVCAPPPWFNDEYKKRQLVVVKNPSKDAIPKGTAIPIVVAKGADVDPENFGAETRFMLYDFGEADINDPEKGWSDVPVYLDVADGESVTVWIPVQEKVPGGGEAVLAWLMTERKDKEPLRVEEPSEVFAFFDETFAGGANTLNTSWTLDSEEVPGVEQGLVTVRNQEQLFLLEPLKQPLSVTLRGRVVGNNCGQPLLVGVQGSLTQPITPLAGFEFKPDLLVDTVFYAEVTSQMPRYLSESPTDIGTPGAEHRYTLEVGEGSVRTLIDGEVLHEGTGGEVPLRPPFADQNMYFTVDVDGTCSFELRGVWVTHPPMDAPKVRVESVTPWRNYE